MGQSIIERFKFWLCDTFGHVLPKFSHEFEGKKVYDCRFCNRMYAKELNDD